MHNKRVRAATYGVALVFLISSACTPTVTPTFTSEPFVPPSEGEVSGEREIVLQAVQGEVSVLNVMSLEENSAVPGQALMLGDTILVGDGSAALAADDGTTVLLDSYSMLTLTLLEGTLEQPRTRFYQWMGEAYHLYEGEMPQDGSYEVEMVGLKASGYGGTWQSSAVFPLESLVQETYAELHGDAPDGDGDGVPDDMDACPTEPGPAWAQDGCPEDPDSDGDGVVDEADACPLEFGSAQESGCPVAGDADADGVADPDDRCPYEPGVASESGCPPIGDSDGDGLTDDVDRCPFHDGAAEQDGCPTTSDTDGDGLVDDQDGCPYIPGLAAEQGCPAAGDADADGLSDADDRCPFIPGPPINSGCPVEEPDGDADGLPDALDGCPLEPGPYAGCPMALDFDLDGVPDEQDYCPSIASPEGADGCPLEEDTDKDGIPDSKDVCPFWEGPANNLGCPSSLLLRYDHDEPTPTPTYVGPIMMNTVEWLERELPTETHTATSTPTPAPKPIDPSKEAVDKKMAASQDCLCEVPSADDIKAQVFEMLSQIMGANQDVVSGVIRDLALVPAWDVGARLTEFSPLQSTDCSEGYSSTVVNLDGEVDVSVTQEDGSQTEDIPLEPNSVMTVAGASPGDSASSVVALTTLPPGANLVIATTVMKLSGGLNVDLPPSSLPPMVIVRTPGGAPCNPLADSFDECKYGKWDYETGECDCSVICPSFTHMQACNAQGHWGCLWVGTACYSTAALPMVEVIKNCYCRSGPGLMYPAITSFMAGTELQILGSSAAFGAVWWQVQIPGEEGACWISGTVVESSVWAYEVPQVTPPPTPTPKPEPEGGGGGGGLHCDGNADSEAACGDGLWDPVAEECDCSVLCKKINDQASCQAHATWYCSWTGSACKGPWD